MYWLQYKTHPHSLCPAMQIKAEREMGIEWVEGREREREAGELLNSPHSDPSKWGPHTEPRDGGGDTLAEEEKEEGHEESASLPPFPLPSPLRLKSGVGYVAARGGVDED